MVEWKCPHCGESMYSAYPNPKSPVVTCINCKKLIPNPYFEQ
jgi:predicted RNA-binding Zn-ribbon protein involved in translation (DUF1610 family)